MNWKKILSSLLTVAFIFGVSVNVNAASLNDIKDAKQTYDKAKDKAQDIKDGKVFDKDNKNRPPEPPKDSDGNPMPPPDKKDGDNSNRPEPPKDSDGKPMPPPDRNSDKSGSELDKAKDKYDNAKDKYDNAKKDYDKIRRATR